MSDELTVQENRLAPVEFASNGSLQLRTLEDAFRLAKAIHQSGLAPKSFGNEQAVLVAILMGSEIGLSPMQAVQSIAVVNGSPKVWGSTALALVRGSGLLEEYNEEYAGDGETRAAIVTIKRKGEAKRIVRFSVQDAKTAELWGKSTWRLYPDRMLLWRARGYALHDNFGDVLKGLRPAEIDDNIPESDHESRIAHAKRAQVVGTPDVPPPPSPAEETTDRPRRGRPPKTRDAEPEAEATAPAETAVENKPDPSQYPDDGTMSPTGIVPGDVSTYPSGQWPAGTVERVQSEAAKLPAESNALALKILPKLAAAGQTVERFLALLRSVKMALGAKTLGEVPAEDLQTCLDDWENVLIRFEQMKK